MIADALRIGLTHFGSRETLTYTAVATYGDCNGGRRQFVNAVERCFVFDKRPHIKEHRPMADADDRPLERRLFNLDSAGLTEQAHDVIDLALPAGARASFRLQRYGVATRPAPRPGRREQLAEIHAKAFAEVRKADTTPRWRSIGPDTIAGVNGSNASGNVIAIAVDPSNPTHLLVAGSAGGIWESRDAGASWAPRGDDQATTSIGALAFHPTDSNVVYCATGDGQGMDYLGVGLLRSTDGGRSWTTLCTAPFVGHGFFDLKVLPGGHLFAASGKGLYVSGDGGVTWVQQRAKKTWSLAVASGAGRPQLLAGCEDGVFESNDLGVHWTQIHLPFAAEILRVAVAISPSDASVAYAWAAYAEATDSAPAVHRLFKREHGQWTRRQEFNYPKLRAVHNWVLAVSPTQPNRVYCGAIHLWRGDIGAETHWTPLTYVNETYRIHPDFHAVAFDPRNSDIVYAGCDGGIFRSQNAGVTWEHLNHGLVISDFRGLAQDLGSSMLLAGLQDNGSIRRIGRHTWESVKGGDGGDCAIKRADPRVMVVTNTHITPAWSESGGAAGSFVRRLPPGTDSEASAFYAPLEYTADNGSTFAIAGVALHITRDDGKTWDQRSYPGPVAVKATAMHIPAFNTIYVGLTDGRVIRTHLVLTGSAWSSCAALASHRAGAVVSDLFVHDDSIWLTSNKDGIGRVFHSGDGGHTWVDRSGGLPDVAVWSIAVDLRHPRMWVGTDCGVWESRDHGATWTPFNTGLPNVVVKQVLFHAPMGLLRAGTCSRGAWEVAVDGWPTR